MKNKIKLKNLTLCAMFIALSVAGAFIKPFGNSIAFDSLPAFLAASIMGPVFGAIVGFLGHIISAALSGFALTLPIHLIIAVEMALVMAAYGFLVKKTGIVFAGIIAVLLNGVAAPAVFILVPGMGINFFLAMVGPLTLVSAINVVLAVLIHLSLDKAGVLKTLK
jgi:uncharacterized membrane protein